MKTPTRILLALAVLGAGALYAFRTPLILALVERGAERNMTANLFVDSADGIELALCGAGGPLPDPKRSGPCTVVHAGKLDIVIDAGTGGVRNLTRMRFNVGGIDAVLLTHFHSDHIDGLGELAMLRWVNAANTEPLPLIGPTGVTEVARGFNIAYEQDAHYRNAHHGEAVAPLQGHGLAPREYPLPEPGQSLTVLEQDGVRVSMFAVNHDPVHPAVGYRIDYGGRSVVLSGDTARSENLERVASGADLLVHEALAPELVLAMKHAATAINRPIVEKILSDIPGYHASPIEAAGSAGAAGVRHLLFNHVVPPLLLPGMESVWLQGVDEAWDGPVTVGVDGTRFSLPAGSTEVRQLSDAL